MTDMPIITEFLGNVIDKRHIHNWKIVREPDETCGTRFWMVEMPRRSTRSAVLFLCERDDDDSLEIIGSDLAPTDGVLQFIYNAQREPGDW